MSRLSFITTLLLIINTLIIFGQDKKVFNVEKYFLENSELLSQKEIEEFRRDMLNSTLSFFHNELEKSPFQRESKLEKKFNSKKEYLESANNAREELKKIIGVTDERKLCEELILLEYSEQKSLISETDNFKIYSVRWPVLEGVNGTGLWIEPKTEIVAQIIALPDASWTPEMFVGLSTGVSKESQIPIKLANSGCRVIIPLLINRECTWSGKEGVVKTNQTHREFIYRRAFEVGRHIIGYEVQKTLSIVDWFTHLNMSNKTYFPIGVTGYGEGGLIAFYSTAIDPRIDGTLISGYFQKREEIWKEPVYRNVWGLLDKFGDAEIAALIAPRNLVIEACKGPEVAGPPAASDEYNDVAAPGRLVTPPVNSVIKEWNRAEKLFQNLKAPNKIQLVVNENGRGPVGSNKALNTFLKGFEIKLKTSKNVVNLNDNRINFDSSKQHYYQFSEINDHLSKIIKNSTFERRKFWGNADYLSIDKWSSTTDYYREYLYKEIIGEMPEPLKNLNIRTKLTYRTPSWDGYWIKLDVWSDLFAGGILLVPNNIKENEKRPIIVCEHGLAGNPERLMDKESKSVYHSYGARLADLGYIVYIPQHIYGLMPEDSYGKESFRIIQRMANPLKKSIYSIVIGNEKQALNWLMQLPFADTSRIALYGLSYGGKTAMRIPAILKDYSMVICSGDFNEWVVKTTSIDNGHSYMYLPEYEMYEFDFANKFNYSELAGLIAPRPFMVERGHQDQVGEDEWVAFEYAKVRKLYYKLGIEEKTDIEFFDGPHEINGVGTFQFLDRHLKK